jgi:hypothetical protein
LINRRRLSFIRSNKLKKWWPKDNPNGIESSKAFEAPVIQHVVSNSPVSQVDVTQVQNKADTTTKQEENHSTDESIPDINADACTVQQANKDNSIFSIEFQNVEADIPQAWLPRTSVHVLEKVAAVVPVEMQSQEVEQTQTQDDDQETFIAAEEHDDVQGNNDAEITVTDREQAAPSMPLDNQEVVYNTEAIASVEINVATLNETD